MSFSFQPRLTEMSPVYKNSKGLALSCHMTRRNTYPVANKQPPSHGGVFQSYGKNHLSPSTVCRNKQFWRRTNS
jgi:hypothetical protein